MLVRVNLKKGDSKGNSIKAGTKEEVKMRYLLQRFDETTNSNLVHAICRNVVLHQDHIYLTLLCLWSNTYVLTRQRMKTLRCSRKSLNKIRIIGT